MKADRETKEKLILSAKSEFMEKGYNKASLRKICENAGVTTGALYFFFKDKADLFSSIVEEPFQLLCNIIKEHFREDVEMLENPTPYEQQDGDHDELVAALIHHIYENRDTFLLLLTKSEGTVYENCTDKLVDIMEQSYRLMAERMLTQLKDMKISVYMLHWLTHMQIDSFVHMITHENDEKKALKHMQKIMDFIVKSWIELTFVPITENDD